VDLTKKDSHITPRTEDSGRKRIVFSACRRPQLISWHPPVRTEFLLLILNILVRPRNWRHILAVVALSLLILVVYYVHVTFGECHPDFLSSALFQSPHNLFFPSTHLIFPVYISNNFLSPNWSGNDRREWWKRKGRRVTKTASNTVQAQ
jgi:hypothetical protein